MLVCQIATKITYYIQVQNSSALHQIQKYFMNPKGKLNVFETH